MVITEKKFVPVAQLPAVQREKVLSRCIRKEEDRPAVVGTLEIEWPDMRVTFDSDAPVAGAVVEVDGNISLPVLGRRLEVLLDLAAPGSGGEWTLKFSVRASEYGGADAVRKLLFDAVSQHDTASGVTVGVAKLQRRSVNSGFAKLRLVPAEDLLQVICRHQNAAGLKAVWKSVLWRLRPQHGKPGTAPRQVVEPCLRVHTAESYQWDSAATEALSLGFALPVKPEGEEPVFSGTGPIAAAGLRRLDGKDETGFFYSRDAYRFTRYFASFGIGGPIPAGAPKGVEVRNGELVVEDVSYLKFREKALAMSQWLNLGWVLPEPPASN